MIPTLACGPYLDLDSTGFWVSLVIFLFFKPVAYFAFLRAFRFRVCRPIPMSTRRTVMLTLARSGLGVLFFALGAAAVYAAQSDAVLRWSWVYLYVSRVWAWIIVGYWGAGLRGRRLVGWIISGTAINAAFDVAFVSGAFAGWIMPTAILAGILGFIWILAIVGRRDSLRARFDSRPTCSKCGYDLLGNLSGRCPECGLVLGCGPRLRTFVDQPRSGRRGEGTGE